MAFLPTADADTEQVVSHIEKIVGSEGLRVLGWRDVPVDDSMIGDGAREVMPRFRQLFIGAAQGQSIDRMTLERLAFVVRKRVEHEVGKSVYFPSLSSRTLVYKGMLTTPQLSEFFPDLNDERVESALALVHSRFSARTRSRRGRSRTRTATSRTTARSTRCRATATGCGRARRCSQSDRIPGDLEPHRSRSSRPGGSDTASFDECLELLHLGGRSLPARRADDDPGGVGEPRDDERREARVLPIPLVAHGAVGRPGVDRVHRRHRRSARCSTATACARVATG